MPNFLYKLALKVNNLNQLTQTSYFDGQFANFTYTDSGQRESASTRTQLLALPQITQYEYDSFDRLNQVTGPDGGAISYSYDANNQIKMMTTPAGITIYDYDALQRLTGVNDSVFVYDSLNLLVSEQLPNGIVTNYGYDDLNRLTNITQSDGNTLLASYAYQLDAAGNRLSVTEAGNGIINWEYDNLYRLTRESRNDGYNAIFTYDAVGNRLSQQSTVNGQPSTVQYTYNNLDQLLTAGGITYEYDLRGNVAEESNGAQITQYQYNATDRLANVTLPDATTITYNYDADGRRIKQTVGSDVTNYLWDETSIYGDVVLETTNGINTSYTLAGSQLISQNNNGATSYFLQDGQGSTRTLTNSAGVVTDTYSYTAFGEIYNQTGTTENNYLYTGQQFDSATNLYSLRARYYSLDIGRFLSQDTYSYNFNNPIELNRYVNTVEIQIITAEPSILGDSHFESNCLPFLFTKSLMINFHHS